MKTVVLDPPPVEVEQLIEQRKRLGLDLHDEIWEGVYHMGPMARFRHSYLDDQVARIIGPHAEAAGLIASGPFNLGDANDFRVPDRGVHQTDPDPDAAYLPTAAVVIEIVSPGDETYDKLPFYAAHGVQEVLVVDPADRRVQGLVLSGGSYQGSEGSTLLSLQASELESAIRWP